MITSISRRPDTMEVWWIGADGSIQHRWWYDTPPYTWHSETFAPPGSAALAGGITSLSRRPDTMEVWWIGAEGSVEHGWWYDTPPYTWHFETFEPPLNTASSSAITSVSRRPDTMEVWWTNLDGSVEHRWWYDAPPYTWHSETFAPLFSASSAGGITSLSRRPDTMEVWWVGDDRSMHHRWWYDTPPYTWSAGTFAPPGSVSGATDITSLSRRPDTMEVWWIGADRSVQHRWWYDTPPYTWSAETFAPPGSAWPGGGITSVSRRPDTMELWFTGADASIQHCWWYETVDCQATEAPYAPYADTVVRADADVHNVEHALLYLVNIERIQAGLPPLCFDGQLASAARAHSDNWAGAPERLCPPHDPPLGCAHWDSRPGLAWPEDRFAASGYCPCTATGENTFTGGGTSDGTNVVPAGWNYATARAAVYWWMNHSPENDYANNGHRAAILNRDFRDAGPGVGRYTDRFGNSAATFTLMFGAR